MKILEIGQYVSVSTAGRIFADLGNIVTKIEPVTGDALRKWGELDESGVSYYFQAQHRDKKIIKINLREEKKALEDILKSSDIVVSNLLISKAKEYGIDGASVREAYPSLVYIQIVGQLGSNEPTLGSMMENESGFRYLSGERNGPPWRTAASVSDDLAGMNAAILALHYVREREHTGIGAYAEVSLLDSILMMTDGAFADLASGRERGRMGNSDPVIAPNSLLRSREGIWIGFSASTDRAYIALMRLIGHIDAIPEHPLELRRARELDVQAWGAARSAATIESAFEGAGVPFARVRTPAEALELYPECFEARRGFKTPLGPLRRALDVELY